MIFLKKSLMTISILVVTIWVIPAISNNLNKIREICAKILTDYCNFQEKNNNATGLQVTYDQEKFFNDLTLNDLTPKEITTEAVKYHIKYLKKEDDLTEDERVNKLNDKISDLTEEVNELNDTLSGLTEYDLFKKLNDKTSVKNLYIKNLYKELQDLTEDELKDDLTEDDLTEDEEIQDLTEDELKELQDLTEDELKELQDIYNNLLKKLDKKISNKQITINMLQELINMLQKVKEDGGPLNYIHNLLKNFATKYIQYQQNSINDLTLTSNNTPMMFCEQHIKNDDEIEKFWTDFFFDIPNSN